MIRKTASLVSYISHLFTLEPGDVILTGWSTLFWGVGLVAGVWVWLTGGPRRYYIDHPRTTPNRPDQPDRRNAMQHS